MSDEASASTPAPTNDSPGQEQPQGGETAQGEGNAPKQRPPQYRKFKDGDEEFSLSDEDIVRERRKWKGADIKFREAAEARKSVEAFMKKLQEDPEAVLNDPRLPIDRRKLAEKWLVKQIDAEVNPPDPKDVALAEARKKLKEHEEREAKAKQDAEEQEKSTVFEQRKSALSATLAEAMQLTRLSAHPESSTAVLREMAMYMRMAKEHGEEVSPKELVDHIHNSRFQQLYTLAHQFEGDELIDFLGEEIVTRIRKADLTRLRAGRDQGASHRTEVQVDKSRAKPQRMDVLAARAHAKKILG